jgi:hypothetical protein
VNLIYTVFYQLQKKDSFLENISQDIEHRIEIDYVEVHGGAFEGWDQRVILAQLVFAGLAEAVCYPSTGSPVPPMEILHKKSLVLAPGSFTHLDSTRAASQMLASGVQELRREIGEKDPALAGFFCLSSTPLWSADTPPSIPELLERVDALRARGGDVLLFREPELYSITAFVNRYTKERVRFVVGLSLLVRTWEYRYTKLGSFLEALSRLLAHNVRIYAYPMRSVDLEQSIQSISATGWKWTNTNGWVTADQLRPGPPLSHLYDYVLAKNFLVPMQIPVDLAACA